MQSAGTRADRDYANEIIGKHVAISALVTPAGQRKSDNEATDVMNERAAVNAAKWFSDWTLIASMLSTVLRVGSVPLRKRMSGALRSVVMPRTIEHLGNAARVDLVAGPHSGLEGGAKRAMDIILGTLALLALSPLLVAAALALLLEAPGRLIVREKRFGPVSRPVDVFKFRSMRMDRCNVAGEHVPQSCATPVGRVLRQLSLDELPQLINVLRGEMSLVGPRSHPLRMHLGEQYCFDAAERYRAWQFVKPGIIGWAQINGSAGAVNTIEKAQRRVDLDLWYLENWSIWLDLQIIVRAALTGFRPENLK